MTFQLDTMTRGYIACALWTGTDETDDAGGEPLDRNYDVSDFTYAAQQAMRDKCDEFLCRDGKAISDAYRASDSDMTAFFEQLGHDLWLSHNGHGASFRDGHPDGIGARLMAAAKRIPEGHVYVTDNGELDIDYMW